MSRIGMLDLRREYEHMRADIDAALRKCLDHQHWILGPEVKAFEETVARYLGVKHCIGASSGTEALVLALRAEAIRRTGREYFGREDLVITTPFTFTATGDAILRSGATPVFVDIDESTCNMDVREVSACIAGHGRKVVGIIPVHLYGQTVDMSAIMEIAGKNRCFVVEDVAQAFGASWRGSKAGSLGTAGAFSFFPSKNLGGFGDGGMVASNDDDINELVRMLLKHGGRDKYNADHIGYNARLDTLQAGVLLAKFRYLDEFNERRRRIAAGYDDELKDLDGRFLSLPRVNAGAFHVYHQFTIRTSRRDALKAHLAEQGVDTMVYYPYLLSSMKVFQGRMESWGDLARARSVSQEVLSLPIEPLQDLEDTMRVVHAIRDFYRTEMAEEAAARSVA